MACIYQIENKKTKKVYIGSTVNFIQREKDHKKKFSSSFFGVTWNKNTKKWFSRFEGERLGTNESEELCAKLYNKKAIKKYGKSYEKLNRNEKGEILL
jgi:predicted GIY-YIG superfamily endonuclease